MRNARSLLLLAMVLLGVGCSSDSGRSLVKNVHGKAFQRGKPLQGAFVYYVPVAGSTTDPVRPRATVGEDGSYRLTTYNTGDGAPAGDYIVCIDWPDKALNQGEVDNTAAPIDRLKGVYKDPGKSPLRRTIQATTTEIEVIELK